MYIFSCWVSPYCYGFSNLFKLRLPLYGQWYFDEGAFFPGFFLFTVISFLPFSVSSTYDMKQLRIKCIVQAIAIVCKRFFEQVFWRKHLIKVDQLVIIRFVSVSMIILIPEIELSTIQIIQLFSTNGCATFIKKIGILTLIRPFCSNLHNFFTMIYSEQRTVFKISASKMYHS